MYDYVIVGAGLFGCTLANELKKKNKVLVVEKKDHIGGTCYTEINKGICVHKYGAHIFRTNDKEICDYLAQFCELVPYTHNVIAKRKDKVYCLPFSLGLLTSFFRTDNLDKISKKLKIKKTKESNLEEKAISTIGETLYKFFVKEYTEKQWGRKCKDLPPSILNGFGLKNGFKYSYFDEKYQYIPKGGYTPIMEKMLEGVDVKLNCDFDVEREIIKCKANKIIHTGMIDRYFGCCFGPLEYRSLKFVEKEYSTKDLQQCAVVNHVSKDVEYTRSIEHRHFDRDCDSEVSIVTYEYPASYDFEKEPYYPINDNRNEELYKRYKELAEKEDIIFAGRLGGYEYNQMSTTIERAIKLAKELEGIF